MPAAHGITLAGATTGAYFNKLHDISVDDISRESIDVTNHDSVTWSEFIPDAITNPGNITGTMQMDDFSTDPPATAVAELWTITWPGGDTWIGSGYLTTSSVTGNRGESTRMSFTIKRSGLWTFGS